MPVPRLPEYERHWARILSDLPEQEGGEAQWRSDGLGHGRRQREREDARLLPRLRGTCLSDLLGHAGPLHHSRREPRRFRPIQAADGNVHGARPRLETARSGPAEIRAHAADVRRHDRLLWKFGVHGYLSAEQRATRMAFEDGGSPRPCVAGVLLDLKPQPIANASVEHHAPDGDRPE